ncbi:MAG: hypothetical protein H6711_32965 [Myxococcales bacterium]|nr:hypothetical protein [Myxococcales bacterium]
MPIASPGIDALLLELDDVIEDARREGDPLGFFAAMYRAVTSRVRDWIRAERFDDGPRMDRFDVRFARRYLDALADWRGGSEAPRCWRYAFEAAADRDATILQHLLLGMNAHINYDLAIVAAEFGAPLDFYGDFSAIGEILAALLDDVQAVIDEFSPAFRLIDRALFSGDEAIANFSIGRARRDAWYHAEVLAATPAEARATSIAYLDRHSARLARLIREPSGVIGHSLRLARALESDDRRAILASLAALR